MAVLATTNRDNFRTALDGLLGSGTVVLEERTLLVPEAGERGKTAGLRTVRRVRLAEQGLLDERTLGTHTDQYADPDGTCPVWERLDDNSRLSFELALPLLSPGVRAVVQSVLDEPVWSRCGESYALSWFLITVTERLDERGLLSYPVVRTLFA